MPMKFTVTIDRDETGAWVAECPAIPGCVSQGETQTRGAQERARSHRALPGSPR